MNRAAQAVFPAVIVGSLLIVFLVSLVANPQMVLAKSPSNSAEEVFSTGQGCSLGANISASVVQWCDLIEKYAREHGLEPQLIAAVMQIESQGDPQAYSHSGAAGLLQVMPSDGLSASFMCANGPCFANRPTTQQLFDPEFNLNYGAGMLSGLLQKYNDLREALRAYGPMDVGYSYADQVLSVYNGN